MARAGARPVSRTVATERLVIGTAAFGQPYGATNTRGQVPETIAGEVLERASALGIDTIDTAPAYGAAEALLGRLPQARRFAVVTKFNLPGETKGRDTATAVVEELCRSLRDLDRRKVDALLRHRGSDLLGPHGDDLLRGLRQAKTNGLRIVSASPSTTATRPTRSCRAFGRTSCSCRSAWWTSGSSPADIWSVWRIWAWKFMHARHFFRACCLRRSAGRDGLRTVRIYFGSTTNVLRRA